ncbi:MAG: diguanylate cyclase, partial [Patescibacteria group bacterium]|nr:diguanylate cyclase [Patescibacteria group bacterium]
MSTRPEITSTFSQPNNEKGMISPETNIVLTGCTADSDGKGKTDVSCPPYPVFHLSRDPPIKMSKWSGVQLTINNDQYVIQYTTPTGTNQYTLFASDASGSPIKTFNFNNSSIGRIVTNIFQKTNHASNLPPTKEDLYQYALAIVNKDRADHGLRSLSLSHISSAQNHADDMLNAEYFSHWNTDGVKPYVTYTKLGGRGDVNENISVTSSYCPSSNCAPYSFDPFKQINDSHGHAVGDQILVVVADNLRRASRVNSVVARIGGEEFVIAETTEGDEAQTSAEDMRAAVESTQW